MAKITNYDSVLLRSVIPQSDIANFKYLALYTDCILNLEAVKLHDNYFHENQ